MWPKLFNASSENIVRTLEWDDMGVKIDGRQLHISDLRIWRIMDELDKGMQREMSDDDDDDVDERRQRQK
ncbi:unnamed protein product [Nippostrongylus brasiliensis]|uniref:SWIB domain-containing protein n=1 Tax=Nippostrongylus brasiliensis TaxID=27835 RepID=A0A0N4YRA7_NIPBR|nr:unnamed protein product [Nippostrongylus brasiliensis]